MVILRDDFYRPVGNSVSSVHCRFEFHEPRSTQNDFLFSRELIRTKRDILDTTAVHVSQSNIDVYDSKRSFNVKKSALMGYAFLFHVLKCISRR